MTLSAGSRLGPYEILSPLGAGGMGEVYRALDSRLGREVAVKVLPERIGVDPDALARFEREARAVAALSHPNILGLFDFGTEGVTTYSVSELLEGQTLRDRLGGGPVPVRKAVEYAAQIARGLAAAHEKGIVHRDVKPENIFITSDGRVKILDFGLARQTALGAAPDDTQSPTVAGGTSPGMVMGTVGYMSPEQVRGAPADHRSDIFSFGSVLYEMLSGRRAFGRATGAETMTAILKEDPPELSESGTDLSPALAATVRHCLEKNPAERFQSARDLAFDLEHAVGSSAPSRTRADAGPRRAKRTPWTAAGSALAGLALLAAGAFLATRLHRYEAPRFRQLTFHRGYVESARFSPDGQTVIYGSTRRDQPVRIYAARLDSIESTPLDLPSGTVLGISRTGEMALLLGCVHRGYWIRSGTLARAPLGGGAPRDVLEHVTDGDISPDGQALAVVREIGARQRLEFPMGRTIAETDGWISHPRISADGQNVAFLEHPFYGNDAGYVSVARLRTAGVERLTDLNSGLDGLAWSPDGKEVWFTGNVEGAGAKDNGTRYSLWAARRGATPRMVYVPPMNLRIHDVSGKGTVLLSGDDRRGEIGGLLKGDLRERDLSTWSDEALGAISEDGSGYLGIEQSAPGASVDPFLYFRRAGDSAPARLGSGNGIALSPGGKWIANVQRVQETARLSLVPTGPGEATPIDLGTVQPRVAAHERATFSSDGRRFLFPGFEPNRRPRAWLIEFPKGRPRALTPEGESLALLSPDGETVAGVDARGRILLYRVAGGDPTEVRGALPYELPIQWEETGRALFIWDRTWPARIARLDLATGARVIWKELSPDPVGVLYGNLVLTPDGKHYVYRIRRVLSELNLAEGLK